MNATLVDFAKDRFVYNFTNCTKEELDNKLNYFFPPKVINIKEKIKAEKFIQKAIKLYGPS
ncbi:MAG: hypothetical protein WDN26_16830 [Chitinophagaceae bacterium]